MGVAKENIKTKSGIIVPISLAQKSQDNRTTSNPYSNLDYVIVAVASDVNKNIKKLGALPKVVIPGTEGKKARMKVEVFDWVITAENMEPSTIKEGPEVYFVWHYMDIFGISKSKQNLDKLKEKLLKENK